MKNRILCGIITVLILVLLVLVLIASRTSPDTGSTTPSGSTTVPATEPESTVPSTTTRPTEPPTVPPTEPPTEPPTVPPTEPPTEPPTTGPSIQYPDSWEGIGLYSRAELEALSNKKFPFGPGRTSGGKRPPYPEADQAKYSQYGANFIAPDNGKIYLTFDCGYEYTATDVDGTTYRVTERILDVLKEKNVKAVFFITMHYARSQQDLVQRMIDEGHIVGNHTNDHPVMPDISIDRMIYEVMSLHDYVVEHYGYQMHLFRPPTGAYSVQSLAVVQNLGYKNVHWSFAYADYDTNAQPEKEAAMQLVTGSAHSGAIYLLHAVSTTNAEILGDVIDAFRLEGYEIDLFQ